jgi:hypothetical protein
MWAAFFSGSSAAFLLSMGAQRSGDAEMIDPDAVKHLLIVELILTGLVGLSVGFWAGYASGWVWAVVRKNCCRRTDALSGL